MLKKMLSIISLVIKRKKRYLKKTHNFVIEVPKSVAQVYDLDEINCNTLWSDYISKEMKDVSPAFRKLKNGDILPIGYQRVNFHMIFDVKMEDSWRKVILVAGGHVT